MRRLFLGLAIMLVLPLAGHADVDLAGRRLIIALNVGQNGQSLDPNYNKYFDPQLPLPADGSEDAAFNQLVDSYVNMYGFDQYLGCSQIFAVAFLDNNPPALQLIQGLQQQGATDIELFNALNNTHFSTTVFQFPKPGQPNPQPNLPDNDDVVTVINLVYTSSFSVQTELQTFSKTTTLLNALQGGKSYDIPYFNLQNGTAIPSTGIPTQPSDIQKMIDVVSDPNWVDPTALLKAYDNMNFLLTQAQANNGALEPAFLELFGIDLSSGLTAQNFTPLFAIASDPQFNGAAAVHALQFVNALNTTQVTVEGTSWTGMKALTYLTGIGPGKNGSFDKAGVQFIFSQLFDKNGNPTLDYTDPVQGSKVLIQAGAYLTDLRATPGALDALASLTGVSLPTSGPLIHGTDNSQLLFLISQLFDVNGQQTVAYTNPLQATIDVVHANAYLLALRQTPGALAALQKITGERLPASGPLTSAQIQFLFTLLFNADGTPTLAYSNPTKAAQELVSTASSFPTSKIIGLAGLGILLAFLLIKGISGISLWGWIGIGGLAVGLLLLLLLQHGTPKDQALGAGDAPALMDVTTSQKNSSSGEAAASPTGLTAPAATAAGQTATAAFPNRALNSGPVTTGQGSANANTSANPKPGTTSASGAAATLVSPQTLPHANTEVSGGTDGPFDPAHAYVPFYLKDGSAPTGLASNTMAVQSLHTQQTDLTAAMTPHTAIDLAVNSVRDAGAADKTVTPIKIKPE